MHDIELSGLDGGNLLGYLAALGVLRLLTLAEPEAEVRMSWTEKGQWSPAVHHSRISTGEELIAVLAARVTPVLAVTPKKKSKEKQFDYRADDIELALNNVTHAYRQDHLDKNLDGFRKELERAVREPKRREEADFFASLGSDGFTENKDGKPATTEFRAIGAGNNEGFLGFMRTIHLETRAEHLKKALFFKWDYSDPPPFMRWDSNEHRPHALRATDPAKDRKKNNVRGANRLAIEALPLFPTSPEARQLRTVGFEDRDGQTEISWPIWTESLDLNTVASLVASQEIQKIGQPPMRTVLARRGIAQVFRARRFTEGKYRNFTPARALL